MEIETLLKKIRTDMDDPDLDIVKKAYKVASEAHEGQFRVSGEPYVEHPINVGYILADLGLDIISISAALLHDVVEDTKFTRKDIEKMFGNEVALLVDGVTKLTKLDFKSKEEHQAESLRKMFLAMAKDIRVVLIKLADRLHNMRTLEHLGREKQIFKSEETIEIYAPLAHRLGMSRMKSELEDLSFYFLQTDVYNELEKKIEENRSSRNNNIQKAIDTLEEKIEEQNLNAEIYGRSKHLYSIYQKMQRKEVDFSEIYDLTAVRVLVDNVRECYQVLGVVHELWKPMPGRFKDYIAMPKSNMYQSLHTTVIGPSGDPLEVQIRTHEMHKTAEYGIAAHWRYKEGKTNNDDYEEKLSWLRQLLEWQKDLQEPQEFMKALKIDLFQDEVFVFTPKGDVMSLARGGTPIDFAYHIHTEVGHNCVGAKVNGKIVPLEYELNNGDIVNIITSKKSTGPSKDWLNFIKTSTARSKIKRWFKKQQRDEIIKRGRELLNREFNRNHIEITGKEREQKLEEIAKELGENSKENLLESIGYNNVSVKQVINKLDIEEQKEVTLEELKSAPSTKSSDKGVKVKGVDNLKVRTAKCCNPVPGDKIVGYITRGRGISIHRKGCPNLQTLIENENERIIDVEWDRKRAESYVVDLNIEAVDKSALLNDITRLIKNEQIKLLSVNARADKYGRTYIKLSLELSSIEHMKDIMNKIKDISGVLSVQRANPT
jgi:GTP pyrophosphokinase